MPAISFLDGSSNSTFSALVHSSEGGMIAGVNLISFSKGKVILSPSTSGAIIVK